MSRRIAPSLACSILALIAVPVPPVRAATVEKTSSGITTLIGDTRLGVEVLADDIIHVTATKEPQPPVHPSLVVLPGAPGAAPSWTLSGGPGEAVLTTAKLRVRLDLATGAISYFTADGQPVLAERAGGRILEPAAVQGEQTYHLRQQWLADAGESLHGLGQQQYGLVDLKGYDLDLWQHNTNVVVPFLVSSRGFGILWDNTSYSRFGDLRPFTQIPAADLVDASGQPGGLTRGTFTAAAPDQLANPASTPLLANGGTRGRIDLPVGGSIDTTAAAPGGGARRGGRGGAGGPAGTRWTGELVAPASGDFQFQTYANGGIKVWFDGHLVIDHWRQNWLTSTDVFKVRLEAGKHYALRMESGGDQATTVCLLWKTPPSAEEAAALSLWSEVGDGINYYFVYGPELDQVVAGYRRLTGPATMLPRWAFGLWQSYQRYERAQQSLDVVAGFRSRGIPFDNIVQDWQYWPRDAWGSHQFDAARYPDPDAWIKSIHEQHANLMVSVWGKFYSGDYAGNANFLAMQAAGFLYQPPLTERLKDWIGFEYTFYDAFNPAARKLFWEQINAGLFRRGVDAWWMDATEPDLTASPPTLEGQRTNMNPTALGTASRMMNGYALENSRGIFEGQRAAAPDQRVFILTRSGFAGEQRYSAVTWSGDITSTWTAMKKQIAAGLGFSVSGTPYWTMDTGGYTMESRFSAQNITPANAEEWRELNARWFEFSTFTPFLRVHGELRQREMWTLGGETHPAYLAELKFDRLRYALLPYLYSLAGGVTQDAGTMMRPLVMDFRLDPAAREIADQFMFGPAFLVSPVTTYQARSRSVYLPPTPGGWYDFWTGAALAGGQTLEAQAPFDAMPLHIRAGAIIPFGPVLQYTGEKPADPITLCVYAGADGAFTLYEDDGLTNGYEKGQFTQIPLRWNDATRTLTVGRRTGAFPGMLAERTFNLVVVSKDQPAGFSFDPKPVATIRYHGDAADLKP